MYGIGILSFLFALYTLFLDKPNYHTLDGDLDKVKEQLYNVEKIQSQMLEVLINENKKQQIIGLPVDTLKAKKVGSK